MKIINQIVLRNAMKRKIETENYVQEFFQCNQDA